MVPPTTRSLLVYTPTSQELLNTSPSPPNAGALGHEGKDEDQRPNAHTLEQHCLILFMYLFIFLNDIELIYNIILVSGVQHSDSIFL